MKPHEETLVVAAENSDQSALVSVSDDRMVCVFRAQEAEEWIRLMQQASAMARALLASGRFSQGSPRDVSWHTNVCWDSGERECTRDCGDVRALLTDAGVLP